MTFLKEHSLSIIFAILAIFFTVTSILVTVPEEGWKEWYKDYSNNGSTEMLQLFMIVVFTKVFKERGKRPSAESK